MSEQLEKPTRGAGLIAGLKAYHEINGTKKTTRGEIRLSMSPVERAIRIGFVALAAIVAGNPMDTNAHPFINASCITHEGQPAIGMNYSRQLPRIVTGELSLIYLSKDGETEAVFPFDDDDWRKDGFIPAYQDPEQWIPLKDSTEGDTITLAEGRLNHEQARNGQFKQLDQLVIERKICDL